MHIPVLLQEVINGLGLRPGMVVVDGTLGLGGHARAIALHIGKKGILIGFDRDQKNLQKAQDVLSDLPTQKIFLHDSFDNLAFQLTKNAITGIDAMLLDLGLSSPHVDDPSRGFSFQKDGPLDLRFDQTAAIPMASDLINRLDVGELTRIFRHYGEESRAFKIATAIVVHRRLHPFITTRDLATLCEKLYPQRYSGIHPATKIFQALRIAVNDELGALERVLPQALSLLRPSGRLAIIAYHSLEDRIVKNFFRSASKLCVCPQEVLRCMCDGNQAKLRILTKKPLTASAQELTMNPRSRSAKLRIAEKIGYTQR